MKISQLITEGKPAETCPACGGTPVHKTHRILGKNAAGETVWKCKTGGGTYVKGGGSPAVATRYGSAGGTPAPTAAGGAATGTPATKRITAPADPALEAKKERISAWLKDHLINKFTIEDDLTVNVKESVTIHDYKHPTLPVKFGTIKGSFMIFNSSITSLKNGPDTIEGDYLVIDGCQITSLDDFPTKVKNITLHNLPKLTQIKANKRVIVQDQFAVGGCPIKNLDGIDGVISCAELVMAVPIIGDVLNVMEIPKLKKVNFAPDTADLDWSDRTNFQKVYQTLTKLINNSLQQGGDMILLQDDLIQGGLGIFAGLDIDDSTSQLPSFKQKDGSSMSFEDYIKANYNKSTPTV